MNAHDAEIHRELAALYSVGALPDADRAQFEAHLADGCATCDAELALLRPAIDALAADVEAVAPRAELRERLLARARSEDERPRPGTVTPLRQRIPLLAAAASVLLAVILTTQLLSLRSELRGAQDRTDELGRILDTERAELQKVRAELDDARSAGTLLTAQVSALEATARVLTAPATRSVSLAGQGEGAAARARAFLSPDTQTLILYAYDLPELPADRTYQAWVIAGKTPVPAGVFAAASGGTARHEISGVAGLEAPVTVAVTIEPHGGLPQPSGPIVLAGK